MLTKDPKELLQKIVTREDDERVNLHEAHLILELAYPTVARYAKRGYFKTLRLGSRRLVTISELRRFIQEGNSPASSPQSSTTAQIPKDTADAS